jgi:hypothetical protein
MMYSYHSISELQNSLSEDESDTPQMRHYICFKDTRYLFYLLFMMMLILFLIFIAIVITNYSS